MRSYMSNGEGNYGNYQDAWEQSLAGFTLGDPRVMATNSGASFDQEKGQIILESMGQQLLISHPAGKVTFASTGLEPVFVWRLIVINYLVRAKGNPLEGQYISYRELEYGNVYFLAFKREVLAGLTKLVDTYATGEIYSALTHLGGKAWDGSADLAAVLWIFPRFPIYLKFWCADDELSANANMLFDQTASHYLHTEDVAVLGGLVVNFIRKELDH